MKLFLSALILASLARAASTATTATEPATTEPKEYRFNVLGKTYTAKESDTVKSLWTKINDDFKDAKTICDASHKSVEFTKVIKDVWKLQSDPYDIALRPVHHYLNGKHEKVYVCPKDLEKQESLFAALGITGKDYEAMDFKNPLPRNQMSTPLYILSKAETEDKNLRRVVDHFQHTHYIVANDMDGLKTKLLEMGKELDHPVWKHENHIKVCQQNGKNVTDPAKLPTEFSTRHVFINDDEGAKIVSVCEGDKYEDLLKRVYGDNIDKLVIDGVTNLTDEIKPSLYMASKYPAQTDILPILVVKRGASNFKYSLKSGKKVFEGIAKYGSANKVTAKVLHEELEKDSKMRAIFFGGIMAKYGTFDHGSSQALCDDAGNEADSFTIIVPTDAAIVPTLTINYEPVTINVGNINLSYLYFFNKNEQVDFSVCKNKNTAQNIRDRLIKLFRDDKVKVHVKGKAVSNDKVTDDVLLGMFKPNQAVKVEVNEAKLGPRDPIAVAHTPSAAIEADGTGILGSASSVTDAILSPKTTTTPNPRSSYRKFLVALMVLLMALIIACLVYYFTSDDGEQEETLEEVSVPLEAVPHVEEPKNGDQEQV